MTQCHVLVGVVIVVDVSMGQFFFGGLPQINYFYMEIQGSSSQRVVEIQRDSLWVTLNDVSFERLA